MIHMPAVLFSLAQTDEPFNSSSFLMARIAIILVLVALSLVVAIFYILTLSRALQKCSPQSRTMQPGMAWLLLIPLVSIIWHFFVVLALSASLGNEFRARNIVAPPEPGKGIGLALCICSAVSIIPILGILTGIAGFVLFIMYWIKIAEFSRMLDQPPVIGWNPGSTPGY
jgi:hypothetical protein